MSFDELGGFHLKRKTFDDVINDAYLDFLFNVEKDAPSVMFGDFLPMETPNRNPVQVPDGLWILLIQKHIKKHFYN